MKNPKKPTRNQKILIKSKRLNPDNWLIARENPSELIIYNKEKGTLKTIKKC